MQHLKPHQSTSHEYNDGAVRVTEYNFVHDSTFGDAAIVLTGRYPETGFAVNDVCTALVSVEEGEGNIAIKGGASVALFPGDRILIKPGEPYYFTVLGRLAIRYIATPAWTNEQARNIE